MLNFLKLLLISLFTTSLAAQVASTPTIVPSTTAVCTDVKASFSAQTTGTITGYKWTVFPSKTLLTSGEETSVFSVTFPKDLTYTVTLVTSSHSGTASATRQVNVFRSAVAAFNASLNSVGHPTELILTNYSSGSQKNAWIFSGEQAADSSFNAVKHYKSAGNYSVTLIAFGAKGCNDTTSYSFRISDSSSVVLPNIFTPNRDEVNDIFKPLTRGISTLNAYILNREGVMLYSWHKVNGFWDGRTLSGELCADGVYFIVLDAKGFDGKDYKLNSTVTLLK